MDSSCFADRGPHMELQNLLKAAVIAVLSAAATPGFAASTTTPTVEEQVQALRQLVERQQAQLDEQQQQLAAQRAELDQLRTTRSEVTAPPPTDTGTRLDAVERSLEQAKVAAQDSPTVRMNANRASITSADGRSSLVVRANVQLDFAHHDQDPAGPLETDFRRGSVGSGSRENDAARDLSDGAYFRRARFGVEGTIARDFNYRFLMELGGSGTEGPTRINDGYVAYTGLAPFTC